MKKDILETLKRLYRQRAKTDKKPVMAKETVIPALRKDGIVVLPDFYTPDFCERARHSIDEYIERNKDRSSLIREKVRNPEFKRGFPMEDGTNYWIDSLESDKRILFSEKISSDIDSFSKNEKFINQGKAMLNHDINLQYAMANKTTFLANNLGSGGGWHRDNNYQHGYKALVYLTDVDENNGPFEYIKQTFTLKNHLVDFPYPDKYQFTEEEINAFIKKHPQLYMRTTASAGSVVLFNTNGIHRGRPLRSGTRYAITNYYI